MADRIIASLHTLLSDGSEVQQGQTVDLTAEDEKTLDEQGALVPESFESFAQFSDYKIDSYRAARGDMEAAARISQSSLQGRIDAHTAQLAQRAMEGGVEDVTLPGGANDFVTAIRDQHPTVDETVALAEGDPTKAAQVLEAENVVTGGNPRRGVVEGLERITAADGQ